MMAGGLGRTQLTLMMLARRGLVPCCLPSGLEGLRGRSRVSIKGPLLLQIPGHTQQVAKEISIHLESRWVAHNCEVFSIQD